MSQPTQPSLARLRDQARLLRRQLLEGGRDAAAVLVRYCRVFEGIAPELLLAEPQRLKHKHALEAIARAAGYASWETARSALEPGNPDDRFYPVSGSRYLNQWYRCYDDAKRGLTESGGFLFPYRNQFFVCEAALVEDLGVSPDDPDWARIGFDWVRPLDLSARHRLEVKLDAARQSRGAGPEDPSGPPAAR